MSAGISVRELLRQGEVSLQERGISEARVLAERLLEGVLACRRHELYVRDERAVTDADKERFFAFLEQRARGIPCQYILGQAEFMDFVFEVNEKVLIPRPETELLVEKIVRHVQALPCAEEINILDMGTGSGAIAVSLAVYLPQVRIAATDISQDALAVARRNARRYDVEARMRFTRGDLFDGIAADEKFDVIVSNPPYLSERELTEADAEVRQEPRQALVGGEKGTEVIERLCAAARHFLAPGGRLFLEIGGRQGEAAAEILTRQQWNFKISKDYSQWDRMIEVW